MTFNTMIEGVDSNKYIYVGFRCSEINMYIFSFAWQICEMSIRRGGGLSQGLSSLGF